MMYEGSCHCGAITFEAEGTLEQIMDCNCSHCSRKGYLLWFVPRSQFRLKSPAEAEMGDLYLQQARDQASLLQEVRLCTVWFWLGPQRQRHGSGQCALRRCRSVDVEGDAGGWEEFLIGSRAWAVCIYADLPCTAGADPVRCSCPRHSEIRLQRDIPAGHIRLCSRS